jgi:triacylglycerol lipase
MTFPKLRSPIVLVHGLLGCARIQIAGWTLFSYFRDIPEALIEAGNRVLIPHLSPTEGIARRAEQLKAFLDRETPGEAVHLIAHSMGGLDSRYMVSRLNMAERVLTLTTLGTPHRGTAFADWGIRNVAPFVGPFFNLLGLSQQAFHDLTIASCRRFNEEVPDAPNVRYFSVAARFTADWRTPEWQLSHPIIQEKEGDNDGLVSVASARYGEDCNIWEGDHASLINRALPGMVASGSWRDRRPQYAALLRRLAEEGFA